MRLHSRKAVLCLLAAAACLGVAAPCRAAPSWQVNVTPSTGLLQGAAYAGRPVLGASSGPLVSAHVEFPLPPGDLAVRLDRGWKVIAGPPDAVGPAQAALAVRKPMTLEWAFAVETPGTRRAWLLARHSELGPQGRDLADAYQVSLDGRPLSGAWRRLAVRSFGNAWLGWLDLGAFDLAAGEHRLRITTRQDWCFLDRLLLTSSGADPAAFAARLASPRTRVKRLPSGAVQIEHAAGPLRLAVRIEPAGEALRLRGRMRWRGDPTVLRGVTWRVPIAVSGDAARLAFPGALPPGPLPLPPSLTLQRASPAAPRRVAPRPGSPLVIFHDGADRGLAALAYSTASTADLAVVGAPDHVVLEVRLNTFGHLSPGAVVDLDQVLVAPTRGDLLRAADAFPSLYRAAGLRPPPRRAAWARDLVIYSAHPGGPIERNFALPGGFEEFAQRLPALARMGITGLWLLPIFEHGPNPYSLYGPVDQFAPARRLGAPRDLRALVDAAHGLGIKVFFDFVPHGPPQDSALAQQFADAICLDEAGNPKTRWGWAFDYANPRWQQYLHDAAAHSARAFGIDGTRIDVFHGAANWDPRLPNLASFPVLGGGLGMARAIRSGIAREKGACFVVPESYSVSPAMWSVAEATYDGALYFLLEDLARRDPPPDQWADALSWFLELQGRSLPPWALKMRFLANHDTVLTNFLKARPAVAFGSERSHALAAIITFARGIPMIYQGEADPTWWGGDVPSSVEFYTRLFSLRRQLEPLRRGAADYRAVRASPGVWTCLRRTDTAWALGVVSLWPQPRDLRLSLPADLTSPFDDAWGGARLSHRGRTVRLRLPAYGIALLVPTPPSP